MASPDETLYCVCGEPEHEPNETCPGPNGDLGMCPYYQRYIGVPGADPEGVCMQMGVCTCAGEPQCVTWQPLEGWYSTRAHFGRSEREA